MIKQYRHVYAPKLSRSVKLTRGTAKENATEVLIWCALLCEQVAFPSSQSQDIYPAIRNCDKDADPMTIGTQLFNKNHDLLVYSM